MKEIAPGVLHWTARHPKLGIDVSSYYLVPERVVIDPLVPAEGLDAFSDRPEVVLLTNRHHLRDALRFRERFGCAVRCPEPGLHEFANGEPVEGYAFGEEAAPGVLALEVGRLCPDEGALYVSREGGILAVADGVVRPGDGPLGFVPDQYLGDDPEAVKRSLREAYGAIADRHPFEILLLAHGDPLVGGARAALAAFARGD